MSTYKKHVRGITFGSYDPLHFGHVKLFERAKLQCDELIVCVSTNDYIWAKKGHNERYSFSERAHAVGAIRYVDIVDFQSLTFGKKEAIEKYKPDMIFVGDDWRPETFTGEGLGVPVVYLSHTPGISSTQLTA